MGVAHDPTDPRDPRNRKLSFSCSMCDSDIPVDPDIKVGEILYCSYCKMGMKVVEGRDGKLEVEAEEEEGE